MYSNVDIEMAIKDKLLIIDPYDPLRLQPSSYDMTLSSHFAVPRYPDTKIIDIKQKTAIQFDRILTEEFELPAHSFALASTVERVVLSKFIAAHLDGKSSLARLGLLVHLTAGFIDPGFEGTITMELLNCNPVPIKIYAWQPVAQLTVFQLHSSTSQPYQGKYQGQIGPQASFYHRNFG